YTFATFADGELHCSQINDQDGLVINLKYTTESFIDTISDASGRTIRFNYTKDYVNAITQTWAVDNTKLTKTWSIDVADVPTSTITRGHLGTVESKHVPSNAIKRAYTAEMAASDSILASMFGGRGAVAA